MDRNTCPPSPGKPMPWTLVQFKSRYIGQNIRSYEKFSNFMFSKRLRSCFGTPFHFQIYKSLFIL